jgi:hypothetical protein
VLVYNLGSASWAFAFTAIMMVAAILNVAQNKKRLLAVTLDIPQVGSVWWQCDR